MRKISNHQPLTTKTTEMIEEAQKRGHISDLESLINFAKHSSKPVEESYSLKYLGLRDGRFGVTTSRHPMQKLHKSSSVSKIEFLLRSRPDLLLEDKILSRNYVLNRGVLTSGTTNNSINNVSANLLKNPVGGGLY